MGYPNTGVLGKVELTFPPRPLLPASQLARIRCNPSSPSPSLHGAHHIFPLPWADRRSLQPRQHLPGKRDAPRQVSSPGKHWPPTALKSWLAGVMCYPTPGVSFSFASFPPPPPLPGGLSDRQPKPPELRPSVFLDPRLGSRFQVPHPTLGSGDDDPSSLARTSRCIPLH